MPHRTVGDELRWLFRAHGAGEITTREFERRKKDLLDWSKCQLTLPVPASLAHRD